jgi:hypothetical protein
MPSRANARITSGRRVVSHTRAALPEARRDALGRGHIQTIAEVATHHDRTLH